MRFFIIIISAFILLSCSNKITQEILHDNQTVINQNKFRLNVGLIQFKNNYIPPLRYPHIEHLLSKQMPNLIKNWIKDNIEITHNGNNILRITIDEASAKEYDSSSKQSYTKSLGKNEILYRMKLSMIFEVIDKDNPTISKHEIKITAIQADKIIKQSAVQKHENLLNNIINNLMKDFNKEMLRAIPIYFSDILH